MVAHYHVFVNRYWVVLFEWGGAGESQKRRQDAGATAQDAVIVRAGGAAMLRPDRECVVTFEENSASAHTRERRCYLQSLDQIFGCVVITCPCV